MNLDFDGEFVVVRRKTRAQRRTKIPEEVKVM
jgi:hypothetical protein